MKQHYSYLVIVVLRNHVSTNTKNNSQLGFHAFSRIQQLVGLVYFDLNARTSGTKPKPVVPCFRRLRTFSRAWQHQPLFAHLAQFSCFPALGTSSIFLLFCAYCDWSDAICLVLVSSSKVRSFSITIERSGFISLFNDFQFPGNKTLK